MEDYEKKGYLLENFRLFHLRSETAPEVEFHYHEFCKLLFFISGEGNYVVEGQRYVLQPGDLVAIGSRCVHRPELNPDTAYERIILYISPEFLERESTGDCDLTECFSQKAGPVLRLPQSQQRKLMELAHALEQELNGTAYGRDIVSNAALLRLLVHVGRARRHSGTQNPLPEVPQNPRIRELMAYMDAHLEEDLDIDALAEAFFISKYHMMRLFRCQTGQTIHTYLSQRRLLRAQELMRRGIRSTEACYRSGFRSYSSFTRSYHKYFGTTPTGRVNTSHRREEGYE